MMSVSRLGINVNQEETYKSICKIAIWIFNFLWAREGMHFTEENGSGKIQFIDARAGCIWIFIHWGNTVKGGTRQGTERLYERQRGRTAYPSHVTMFIESELAK
jgi:hypothetical protein